MMSGWFVKLYGSILDSSVWATSAECRLLWVTMLAMADENGIVRSSVAGLAHRARISREGCEAGLELLQAPDADSVTPDYDGRRVERVEGGWLVLNARKYRDLRTDSQAKAAERVRRFRERVSTDRDESRRGVTCNARNASNAEKRTEVEVEVEKEEKPLPERKPSGALAEFYELWSVCLKKVSKGEARSAYLKHRKAGTMPDLATVKAALLRMQRTAQWTDANRRRQPYLASWLNKEGWEDQLPQNWNAAGGSAVSSGGLSEMDREVLRNLGKGKAK